MATGPSPSLPNACLSGPQWMAILSRPRLCARPACAAIGVEVEAPRQRAHHAARDLAPRHLLGDYSVSPPSASPRPHRATRSTRWRVSALLLFLRPPPLASQQSARCSSRVRALLAKGIPTVREPETVASAACALALRYARSCVKCLPLCTSEWNAHNRNNPLRTIRYIRPHWDRWVCLKTLAVSTQRPMS